MWYTGSAHEGVAMAEAGRRPTIADIARAVGVTKGAVSFALNGRPGVSEETRARILATAERLGWRPSSAARALSRSTSGVIGLVVTRPAALLGVEPFYMRLIAGLERALQANGQALLLAVTKQFDEVADIHRSWWAERRVDGVILTDPRVDDPRLDLVAELAIPAILLGGTGSHERPGLSTLTADDEPAVSSAVRHLARLGHRHVARIAGPPEFAHATRRNAHFLAGCERHGVRPALAHTRFLADHVLAATRRLLAHADPPTAVVYESDLMAATVVGSAAELGVRVPDDLAVVALEDSPLCELVRPRVTALRGTIDAAGWQLIALLDEHLRTGTPQHAALPPRRLVVRGSTRCDR
jgi:DNA-binding LacI/PurR family transcriptional regulator